IGVNGRLAQNLRIVTPVRTRVCEQDCALPASQKLTCPENSIPRFQNSRFADNQINKISIWHNATTIIAEKTAKKVEPNLTRINYNNCSHLSSSFNQKSEHIRKKFTSFLMERLTLRSRFQKLFKGL